MYAEVRAAGKLDELIDLAMHSSDTRHGDDDVELRADRADDESLFGGGTSKPKPKPKPRQRMKIGPEPASPAWARRVPRRRTWAWRCSVARLRWRTRKGARFGTNTPRVRTRVRTRGWTNKS